MMTVPLGDMLLKILPELGLLVLAAVLLTLDLLWRSRRCRFLGWIAAGGGAVVILLSLLFARPGPEPLLLWGGMMRLDSTGFVFRMLFVTGMAITALFATENEGICEHGEFFTLLVISTLGMTLMASAVDLIMIYLAFETASIPLYALAGFLIRDKKSVESGVKYLLFGAMTSAVMLYGFSLLYGFTGSTNLFEIGAQLSAGQLPAGLAVLTALLVTVGFAFKVSAAPLHFWAPDVYEGAPTSVAGFLSTASKAAGFAVLLRVLLVVYPALSSLWTGLIAALAVASMVVGNLQALNQKNIKRLLAYSSIAQAGTILIGAAAQSDFGVTATMYYLMAYLVTNLAAFGVVMVVGRAVGSDEISAYAGLSRRSPGTALILLAVLLSLGGIPPFAGFIGKLLVFGAAVEANMAWLAVVGVVNSVAALYYYLRVLKVVYLDRAENETQPLNMTSAWKAALVGCVVLVVVLGVLVSPFYTWASQAAASLIVY